MTASSGRIRPFERADIAQVVSVHRQAWGNPPEIPQDVMAEYSAWLSAVFLDHPMRTEGHESIVFEDDGEVVGFFGGVSSHVSLNGTTHPATVWSNFVVHPNRKGKGIGAQLLREALSRSPELSFIDEANDATRNLWERAGGVISLPQCVRWLLPLRPMKNFVSLAQNRVPGPIAKAVAVMTRPLDAVARRLPHSPYRFDRTALTTEPLSASGLAGLLTEFGRADQLRPVANDGSTDWFVARARGMTHHGDLTMTVLRTPRGDTAGWYVYYAKPGGQGEVLQLAATREQASNVLDQLARDASERGVAGLAGILQTDLLLPLAVRFAQFERDPRWMLVYSKHPEILQAFWNDRLLLSRLQGEWSHHLR